MRIKNKQEFTQLKSKEAVLKRLDESRKQTDNGLSKNADVFIKELRDKCGL